MTRARCLSICWGRVSALGVVLVIRDKGEISGIISFDVGERQSAIGAHVGERIWLRPLEAEADVNGVGELDSEGDYRAEGDRVQEYGVEERLTPEGVAGARVGD